MVDRMTCTYTRFSLTIDNIDYVPVIGLSGYILLVPSTLADGRTDWTDGQIDIHLLVASDAE